MPTCSPAAAADEPYQRFVRIQMYSVGKELAHVLELARSGGIVLAAAAVVSQDMARIYRVDDERRPSRGRTLESKDRYGPWVLVAGASNRADLLALLLGAGGERPNEELECALPIA